MQEYWSVKTRISAYFMQYDFWGKKYVILKKNWLYTSVGQSRKRKVVLE